MEIFLEDYFTKNTSGTNKIKCSNYNFTGCEDGKDFKSAQIDILQKLERNQSGIETFAGMAYQFCTNDTTWVQNGRSNYSVCVEELMAKVATKLSVEAVQPFILFVGELLSIICLLSCLTSLGLFRSTLYTRIIVFRNLIIALLGRSIAWIVIVVPSIFPNLFDFRSVAWVGHLVISLQFYIILVTSFWMVVLANYLNDKLMKRHHVDYEISWVRNLLFTWVLPAIIIGLWASSMVIFENSTSWNYYTKSKIFWIISFPLVGAFMACLVYLINILRVFGKQTSRISSLRRRTQIMMARKDLVILFAILGINNLFFYNPTEGQLAKYYLFCHSLFQSAEGILVSFLFSCQSTVLRNRFWKIMRFCRAKDLRLESNRSNLTVNGINVPVGQRKRVTFAENV